MSATPLAGLLVVDLSRHLPGPLTARLLCDLGARIVKVEEPELGDPVRMAPPLRGLRSALASELLAGVESVALDLKQEAGRRVLGRLLDRADVLLESFRPGTLSRLGFSPARLAETHPRLVICSISGWGQRGERAPRSGHDLSYQAIAGTLAATASMPSLPSADLLGAWAATCSILAALLERGRSGRGTHLDAALCDAARHGNLTGFAAETARHRGVGERLALTGALPCYGMYRSRDRHWVAVAALEPKFWKRFCRLVERPDLVSLQYDRSGRGRREVAGVIAGRDRSEWARVFAQHDLPAEPVLSVAEAIAEQDSERPPLVSRARDGLFRLAFPVLFDSRRPRALETVPKLGQHTDQLLHELGMASAFGSPRHRRAAGIGARSRLKRLLWLWSSRSSA